ncbi:phosphate:Na+ symporter [Mycoplasmopsis mustelae]|uniref:Phosphate:Na+ symporter n=1 Tax=Mycoplasmopsis mustelae TaxID=171289 RepID=A0A4V3FNW8_9BACT|nr:Na/Pi symporter [Mycoplasmopsis mustelae]TDV24110.1 phosphate:Na+ symporter [Mycoplasmopsis mustelae]
MNFIDIPIAIIFALASLSLFIYSTKKLSASLKSVGDSRFKKVIKFISKNNYIALLVGVLITTFIQSSDGAMALIMGLLAARFINLRVAIAFLLGANIGTATTSLIVSFQSSFKFTEYFILLMVIGVFGSLLTKKEKISNIFLLILSIGMVFLSLKIMSSAAKTIVQTPFFKSTLGVVAINPWLSFVFSFILTGILQSSSATVTLYQIVYNSADVISNSTEPVLKLNSAIALVFGANLGTTLTGLIVSFTSRNNNSKKIAIIWGFTNLSVALLILPFLYPLTYYADLIKLMIPSEKALQLSIAHLLFNFILVFIFFWLIKYLEKMVNWMIKDNKFEKEFEILLPGELITQNASLALKAAKNALYAQGKISREGMQILYDYINTGNQKLLKHYDYLETVIDETRTSIYNYLIQISTHNLSSEDGKLHLSLVLSSRSVDKIMGLGKQVINELNKTYLTKKQEFDIEKEILTEIKELVDLLNILLKNVINQLDSSTAQRHKFIEKMNKNIHSLTLEFSKTNIERLKNDVDKKQLQQDFDYSILLRTIERIAHHCLRINHYIENSRFKIYNISKTEQDKFIDV